MSSQMGRPTLYNKQVCDEICERIASGESLRAVCLSARMPSKRTVMSWLLDSDKSDFLHQYTQARVVQNLLLSDELVELSNPPENTLDSLLLVNRNRLQIDTRKWWLSKVNPKKYGDKPVVEDVVENDIDMSKWTPEEFAKFKELMSIAAIKKNDDV